MLLVTSGRIGLGSLLLLLNGPVFEGLFYTPYCNNKLAASYATTNCISLSFPQVAFMEKLGSSKEPESFFSFGSRVFGACFELSSKRFKV